MSQECRRTYVTVRAGVGGWVNVGGAFIARPNSRHKSLVTSLLLHVCFKDMFEIEVFDL